jgi:copper homeostasis protein
MATAASPGVAPRRPIPLEVCVDSLASAVAAEQGGAARLEVCANLVDGGTTPSLGLVRALLARVALPLHAMVRPRGGDFLYDEGEREVMRAEIEALKEAGVHGVVVGCLLPDGAVDEPFLIELVALAAPLPVTFHRAIDVSRDPYEAVHVCVRCGVHRVLSSGGRPEALEGAPMLRLMVAAAAGRLTIAAAGGVTEFNASELAAASGADELHGSLRATLHSAMAYRPAIPIAMGAPKLNGPTTEYETRCTDVARVAAVVRALQPTRTPPTTSDTAAAAAAETEALVLIGDLGGTNIRLALYPSGAARGSRPDETRFSARYRTADFGHLREALAVFQAEAVQAGAVSAGAIEAAAISVCGPVVGGVALCQNETFGPNGWRLEETDLATSLGLSPDRLRLLNDFVAVGLALPHVLPSHRQIVHAGSPIPGRPIACLGPGTGLGQVFGVFPAPGAPMVVCPSEGGESDFVARTPDEWALRTHIGAALATSHVKVEHVVSGSGIKRAYDFVRVRRDSTAELIPESAADAAVRDAADPSAVIAALSVPADAHPADPLCTAAMQMFVDALGAEAANLALRVQAHGGVFIAGGVAAKLAHMLTPDTALPADLATGRGAFCERLRSAYLGKGRSVAAYSGCPLYVVTVEGDELAMDGAWACASSELL